MEQHIIFSLRILLGIGLSLTGVLAAPGRNYVANAENGIINDNFKDQVSSSSHSVMFVTKTMIGGLPMVTVTVTTIVDTIADSDALDGNATTDMDKPGNPTDDRHEIVAITQNTKTNTNASTSIDMTPLSINPLTSLQPASSTSSLPQVINTDNATMISAIITAADSSPSPTSTFDDSICDDIFCNTDGNKVCIYWAGMTAWDISLGPIPGEKPTIIGTC